MRTRAASEEGKRLVLRVEEVLGVSGRWMGSCATRVRPCLPVDLEVRGCGTTAAAWWVE